jgi:hypothetical protein
MTNLMLVTNRYKQRRSPRLRRATGAPAVPAQMAGGPSANSALAAGIAGKTTGLSWKLPGGVSRFVT